MDFHSELHRQLSLLNLQVEERLMPQMLLLLEELRRWNNTYNLTSITDSLQMLEKHLVDSLTLLPYIEQSGRMLDIGSGAGFPSLPIKIVSPELDVVSVDSVAKKIRFQKHMTRKLGIDRYEAWHGRAEEIPQQAFFGSGFDLVVARAFSSLPRLVELALPCLHPAGRIIAMKGPEGDDELSGAAEQLDGCNLHNRQLVKLRLPVSGAERRLLILAF